MAILNIKANKIYKLDNNNTQNEKQYEIKIVELL